MDETYFILYCLTPYTLLNGKNNLNSKGNCIACGAQREE